MPFCQVTLQHTSFGATSACQTKGYPCLTGETLSTCNSMQMCLALLGCLVANGIASRMWRSKRKATKGCAPFSQELKWADGNMACLGAISLTPNIAPDSGTIANDLARFSSGVKLANCNLRWDLSSCNKMLCNYQVGNLPCAIRVGAASGSGICRNT